MWIYVQQEVQCCSQHSDQGSQGQACGTLEQGLIEDPEDRWSSNNSRNNKLSRVMVDGMATYSGMRLNGELLFFLRVLVLVIMGRSGLLFDLVDETGHVREIC